MASAVHQRTDSSANDEIAGAAHAKKAKGSHTSFDDVVVALAGVLDVPASDLKNEVSSAGNRPTSPTCDDTKTDLPKATHSTVEVAADPTSVSRQDPVAKQPEEPSVPQADVSLPKISNLDFAAAFVATREAVSPPPQPGGQSSPPPASASIQPPARRLKQPLQVQPAPDTALNRRPARVNTARAAFGRLTSLLRGGASDSDQNVSQQLKDDRRGQTSHDHVIGGAAQAVVSRVSKQTRASSSQPVAQGDSSLEAVLQEITVEVSKKRRNRAFFLSTVSFAWLGTVAYGFYNTGSAEVLSGGMPLNDMAAAAIVAFLPLGVLALAFNAVLGFGGQANAQGRGIEAIDGTSLQLLSKSMRSEIQGMTDSLQKVIMRSSDLEGMIKSEIKALEGAYSENETRMRKIVSDLSFQREAIVSHVERVRRETAELSDTFAGSSNAATVSVKSLQADLIKSITELCEVVEARLKSSKTELESGVTSAVDNARSRLDSDTARLLETFVEKSHELSKAVSQAGAEHLDALANNRERLEQALSNSAAENKSALESGSLQLSQAVSRASSHAKDALTHAGQSVEIAIQQRVKAASDVLSLAANEVIGVIDERGKRTETLLQEELEIEKRLSEQLERLHEINNALNGSGSSIASSILASANTAQSEISACGQAVALTIANRSKAINEAIAKSGEVLAETINSRGEALERSLEEKLGRFEALNEAIKRAGREMGASLAKSVSEAQNDLAASGKSVAANLEQRGREVNAAFVASGARAEKVLSEYAQVLQQRIAGLEEAGESLSGAGVKLSESLVVELAKLKEEITSAGRSVVGAVSERSKSVNEAISNSGEGLVETLNEYASEFEARVDQRIERIESVLSARTDAFEKALGDRLARLDSMVGSLDSAGVSVNSSIAETISRLRKELLGLGDELSLSLAARGSAVAGALANSVKTADGVLKSYQTQIDNVLAGRVAEIDGVVGKRAEAMEAMLQASGNTLFEVNERLGNIFDERLGQIEELMAQREELLEKRVRELSDMVSERLDVELQSVSERAEGLNEILASREESFAALIESDDQLARRVAERVAQAAGSLKKVAEASEEIAELNEESLAKRAARLLDLNKAISERLDDEAAAIDQKVESISAFTEAQAEAFAQLLERDDELTVKLTQRLRAVEEGIEIAGRRAAEQLSSVEESLAKKAEEISKVVESIAEDARTFALEVAQKRSASAADHKSFFRQRLAPENKKQTPDLSTSFSVRMPTPTSAEQKKADRGGWLSDLLQKASGEDDVPATETPTRSRSNARIGVEARGVVSSLTTNIDHILGEQEAYGYWLSVESDNAPLRSVVSDFGQRVYKYLEDTIGDPPLARVLRAYARSFRSSALDLVADGDQDALLEFLVSTEGRVGSVITDVVGELHFIVDAVADVPTKPEPRRTARKRR